MQAKRALTRAKGSIATTRLVGLFLYELSPATTRLLRPVSLRGRFPVKLDL